MNCSTARASHSGQDQLSRLAGFSFRFVWHYILLYTRTSACTSIFVLFPCSLFSPDASGAAWRTDEPGPAA